MRKKVKNILGRLLLIIATTKLNIVHATDVGLCVENDKCFNQSAFQVNMIFVVICLILVLLLFILLFKIVTKRKVSDSNSSEVTDEEIKKFDSSLSRLYIKEEAFSLYKKLETAKTKQNYTSLKEILSEDFYLRQEQELKLMKEHKEKLVATNIHLKDAKILSLKKEKNSIIIELYLYVSQYDYIINKQKQVLRGTDDSEYQIEYKMVLEKKLDKHFIIKEIECVGKWIRN